MDLLRSLPIGLYLEQPITWLHKIDPRVKLFWSLSFLTAPIFANTTCRVAIAGLLIAIGLSAKLPWRALKQQMGWVLIFGSLLFVIAAIAPDSTNVFHQPRDPSEILTVFPSQYKYVLWKGNFGWFQPQVTRKSLETAIESSTLLFTVIYSSSLYLLTSSPEEITEGIDNLLTPLRRLGIPVTEVSLTLTLALRFIPLVLEEVQNLIRSVATRAIDWRKLGWRNGAKVWTIVIEKLLENILSRAEQVAIAMQARGFTSPNTHRVEWHQLTLRRRDWFAVGCLLTLWILRLIFGMEN